MHRKKVITLAFAIGSSEPGQELQATTYRRFNRTHFVIFNGRGILVALEDITHIKVEDLQLMLCSIVTSCLLTWASFACKR